MSLWICYPVPPLRSRVSLLYSHVNHCVYSYQTPLDDAGKKRKKPGQDASRFKTDVETGKMVIGEGSDEEDTNMEEDVEGTAYRETITSADGFTRGPNGRVKFNKDTKKRRREAEADEDVEMGETQAMPAKHAKRRSDAKFGHEFKAKVSRLLKRLTRL